MIVPDELRGRVMSIFFLLFAGSTPIGGWVTGTLAETVGVRDTLIIEAAICTVGIGVAYLYRSSHRESFHSVLREPQAAQASA